MSDMSSVLSTYHAVKLKSNWWHPKFKENKLPEIACPSPTSVRGPNIGKSYDAVFKQHFKDQAKQCCVN